MAAASSSSRGKPRKNCRNKKVAKAEKITGTMSPRSVEIQPRLDTMTKLGTKVTAAGTIKVTTVSPRITVAARLAIRASPYAASAEISTVAAVCTTATTSELARLRTMATFSLANSDRRPASVGSDGTITQRAAASSARVENALRIST